MKLISLNVALFESNNEKLSSFIESSNADILCLQEVTKRVDDETNSAFISLDSIDTASPGLRSSFFAPIWTLKTFDKSDFHGEEHFQFDLGGLAEFGQYIRSRYPITKAQNIFVQNHFSYITDWSNWPAEDYRAVQVTDIELENTHLRILNYHGIWSKDKKGTELTKQACETINSLANEVECPSIICGDFNLFPDTESMAVFSNHQNLLNEYEIRSTRPSSNELNNQSRNVVDYILVSDGIKVNDFQVIDSDVSDHLPLMLDFEL